MAGELSVPYNKLHEWLLARRVVPENYGQLLRGVEAKVNDAMEAKVADEAAKSLIAKYRASGEVVDYFAAKEIYNLIAASPEGKAKTMLGAHSDPGAAKWYAVVAAYNRKHLGWTSAARVLIQNVSYEIPTLKKQVQSCERQVSDCTTRMNDLTKQETNAKARCEALLQEFGIEGLDPRQELLKHAKAELPKVHAELAEVLQTSGKEIVDYYKEFTSLLGASADDLAPLLQAIAQDAEQLNVDELDERVAALKVLRAEAKAAGRNTKMEISEAKADISGTAGEIDWGLDSSGGKEGGIDLGATGGDSGGGGICWDFEAADGNNAAAADGASGGIDWGIEMSGSGDAPADSGATDLAQGGIDWGAVSFAGIELTSAGDDNNGTAESSPLLEDMCVREVLNQEVAEVGAFLQTRLSELEGGSTSCDAGSQKAQKSRQEVSALVDAVTRAEEIMTGKKTQRLLLLLSSERYMDQQLRCLEVARSQSGKPAVLRGKVTKVKAEQAKEGEQARLELEVLRTETIKVQKELEAELSAHFKSPVRIVGDIAKI